MESHVPGLAMAVYPVIPWGSHNLYNFLIVQLFVASFEIYMVVQWSVVSFDTCMVLQLSVVPFESYTVMQLSVDFIRN